MSPPQIRAKEGELKALSMRLVDIKMQTVTNVMMGLATDTDEHLRESTLRSCAGEPMALPKLPDMDNR